ncbi:Lrp/AsnC ligand binding domain-containing protein, partial [Pseudomonas aeruginosa]
LPGTRSLTPKNNLQSSTVRSIDALQHVLINKIQTIDEIQSTETLIVLQNPIMRTIKP